MSPQVLSLLAGTALSLLTQMAAGLLGPFGFMLGMLSPLPAAFAGLRHGWPVAAGIVVATTAALYIITGPIGAVAFFLQYGLPGWLLAFFLRRGRPWDWAVSRTLLVFAGVAAAALFGFVGSQASGLAGLVHRYVQEEVERAMAFWSAADLPADQLQNLRHISEQMADFLIQAWPGLTIAVAGALLLFMVMVLSVFSGDRYRIAGVPFPQWKAPELLIWILILAGAGLLFAEGELRRFALNLLVVVLPVYFLQGLAIVSFWFKKKSISPLFRRLGYLFVFVNPLPMVVTGLGVFDMWVDFRKPRLKKNQ